MILGCIGSCNQNNVRFFNVPNGICHCATSECCGQTGHGGGMSEPGAVVNIVGFHHSPCKFMGKIVFFIGNPGTDEDPNGVRALTHLYIGQVFPRPGSGLHPMMPL